ncbi:MAG TPA: hypothetical protein VI299_23340 [Polyangiales bacterium]
MAIDSHMELAGMEIDELDLSSVHGGFGWFPAQRGHSPFGTGLQTGGHRPQNGPAINIEVNITFINIEGNMNVAGGQDVTLRG